MSHCSIYSFLQRLLYVTDSGQQQTMVYVDSWRLRISAARKLSDMFASTRTALPLHVFTVNKCNEVFSSHRPRGCEINIRPFRNCCFRAVARFVRYFKNLICDRRTCSCFTPYSASFALAMGSWLRSFVPVIYIYISVLTSVIKMVPLPLMGLNELNSLVNQELLAG